MGIQHYLGIVGWSGSGKTSLIKRLIPLFKHLGYRVGVLKHSHHPLLDVHPPKKDTHHYLASGAEEVLLATPNGWVVEHRMPSLPPLETLCSAFSSVDIVLVEGFKAESMPKIEVYRPESGLPPLFIEATYPPPLAVVSTDSQLVCPFPVFSLHELSHLMDWIEKEILKP